ncbi:2-oxo acid dehydrogenase subunit E2 [Nocardia gipuzkoensis]|uniref:2-oxo acid dehydrogenase subunit E2 n=1 Tax=Nocardia gipuzkoensis TaxID=2749991 RepID=UPI001E4162A3|nr:2-oxo acid dehydrogenase subunit E2 [Nocardia gipuzkoensis]UGT67809.1 2-oxo acid dehydrogenase subunit E2 [Nocardia gipuzkoensis]
MTEGTLLHWLVHPGDVVHKGDVVAEVDTTKAAIEVECFDDGVLGTILVPEGKTVPVGTPLATIEPASDRAVVVGDARAAPDGRPPSSSEPAESVRGESLPGPDGATEIAHHATPLIRRLAQEAGIDLATLHGSGPGGRIVRSDVEEAISAGARTAPRPGIVTSGPQEQVGHDERRQARGESGTPERVRPLPPTAVARASGYARRLARESGVDLRDISGTGPDRAVRARDVRTAGAVPEAVPTAAAESAPEQPAGATDVIGAESLPHDPVAVRKVIAAAMTRSKRTVPHYYLSSTIDMDAAMRWLEETNRRVPVSARILSSALVLCASARAARTVPDLNGHWLDDEFRPASAVHLGVVVSLRGGGIMVPTIPDAHTLAPPAMMDALRGAVGRARTARLRSADAVPATITVTNLGELGVDSVFGVIAAPQVAIVGFGAVTARPCAVRGLLGVRPQLTATLSADHRASDGAVGARFLNTVAELLQQPEEM